MPLSSLSNQNVQVGGWGGSEDKFNNVLMIFMSIYQPTLVKWITKQYILPCNRNTSLLLLMEHSQQQYTKTPTTHVIYVWDFSNIETYLIFDNTETWCFHVINSYLKGGLKTNFRVVVQINPKTTEMFNGNGAKWANLHQCTIGFNQ